MPLVPNRPCAVHAFVPVLCPASRYDACEYWLSSVWQAVSWEVLISGLPELRDDLRGFCVSLLALLREAVAGALTDSAACVVSGGVDSSTITMIARELQPGIPTFTGYYEGGDRFDERRYAQLVVNHRTWHQVLITPDDFVEHFDGMVEAAEPPFMGMGTFGQYVVARYVASQDVDVVLSGEGGDELFGGYARLIMVAGGLKPEGYDTYRLPDGYPLNLEDALAYDFDRLPELLAVDDQMCSAWGLEARAPMTDPRVVEWALALPARARVAKRTLKEAVRGLVPDPILNRRDKMGMPIPLVQWANTHAGVRDLVMDRIGYLPDPSKPWDRGWWVELCERSKQRATA